MSIEMVEQEDPSICIHHCWCLHYHFRVLIRFDLILKLILKIFNLDVNNQEMWTFGALDFIWSLYWYCFGTM